MKNIGGFADEKFWLVTKINLRKCRFFARPNNILNKRSTANRLLKSVFSIVFWTKIS